MMAAPAFQFLHAKHAPFVRDYARGFFNTLVDISPPADLTHAEQYRRGATHALVALREWAGPFVKNAVDTYCREWERVTLAHAALERRVDRSLAQCLDLTRRRQKSLQLELDNHEAPSHPTRDALKQLIARSAGEARQLVKEIAAREKNPFPCLACPAALLCRDQQLACNSYFRFATINEMSQAKRNAAPLERMPPSRHWYKLTFDGGA